ncbi:MAG: hypothetical protein DLM56_08880 [Pseudonocardiales bacterium]|nr:MAG: hypothetical protein DLM56_08880 [Pseudonocardiales bacterium]
MRARTGLGRIQMQVNRACRLISSCSRPTRRLRRRWGRTCPCSDRLCSNGVGSISVGSTGVGSTGVGSTGVGAACDASSARSASRLPW